MTSERLPVALAAAAVLTPPNMDYTDMNVLDIGQPE